jgi:hypothetical protein
MLDGMVAGFGDATAAVNTAASTKFSEWLSGQEPLSVRSAPDLTRSPNVGAVGCVLVGPNWNATGLFATVRRIPEPGHGGD